MNIGNDDMDAIDIDITASKRLLIQRCDAMWVGLDVCPWTCPSNGASLCTYADWFAIARPVDKHTQSLTDICVSNE